MTYQFFDAYGSVLTADSNVVGGAHQPIVQTSSVIGWSTQTSVMYGVSVLAVTAPGTSVFNYLSGVQIANDSGTFSRVKITGGLGSVLAWTVAPANGGSNITFVNPIKVGANSGISASINGVSSVYISMQGFTSKT